MEKHILKCSRSGVPMLEITTLIGGGAWPLLNTPQFTRAIHPIYARPLHAIIGRMGDCAAALEDAGYIFAHEAQYLEAALTISAGLHAISAIWEPHIDSTKVPEPSLPSEAVTVSCLRRTHQLLSWYHFMTSKRLSFPLYRPTVSNTNEHWENLASWLDACDDIKCEWELGRSTRDIDADIEARKEAQEYVSVAHMVEKIDHRKVWNWIHIQLNADGRYAAGRIKTFETIYLSGEREPERWTQDDIEDVQQAIMECCDVRNDVYQFVVLRLRRIAASIADFFGGFNVLDTPVHTVTTQEKEKTEALLADYDAQLIGLDKMPDAPQREQFASLALYLRANAQHNILSRRWKLLQSKQTSDQSTDDQL